MMADFFKRFRRVANAGLSSSEDRHHVIALADRLAELGWAQPIEEALREYSKTQTVGASWDDAGHLTASAEAVLAVGACFTEDARRFSSVIPGRTTRVIDRMDVSRLLRRAANAADVGVLREQSRLFAEAGNKEISSINASITEMEKKLSKEGIQRPFEPSEGHLEERLRELRTCRDLALRQRIAESTAKIDEISLVQLSRGRPSGSKKWSSDQPRSVRHLTARASDLRKHREAGGGDA